MTCGNSSWGIAGWGYSGRMAIGARRRFGQGRRRAAAAPRQRVGGTLSVQPGARHPRTSQQAVAWPPAQCPGWLRTGSPACRAHVHAHVLSGRMKKTTGYAAGVGSRLAAGRQALRCGTTSRAAASSCHGTGAAAASGSAGFSLAGWPLPNRKPPFSAAGPRNVAGAADRRFCRGPATQASRNFSQLPQEHPDTDQDRARTGR